MTEVDAEDAWSKLNVAARVARKLLGNVQDQQLLPGPGSQGDGGNVTGALGCLGTPRSQSRSSARGAVGLKRNRTVINKKGRI